MSPDLVTVEVPDIGDFEDVPVIEVLVSSGDQVAPDDPLLTLESDKATMDVPSPFAGVVHEMLVKVGDKVSQGARLLTIEPAADGASSRPTKASAVASDGAPTEAAAPDALTSALYGDPPLPLQPQPPAETRQPIYASPSVRRLARERAVDLATLTGTGRKGRITREDVESAAARPADGGTVSPAAGGPAVPTGAGGPGAGGPGAGGPGIAPGLGLPPWPSVDFEKFGPVERVERSRIQRISAPNLARNWVMIPHVTHDDEADITELEAWRKNLNEEQARTDDAVKVTMVSFLVLASVATLKQFPTFNASLDGEQLVLKRYYNIGFAADTPGGLLVPVIKDADRKGLLEIAGELTELSGKARAGKLTLDEMQGATFTISSLGGIGGTSFTPIINAPEVAILGATRSAFKPVWNGSEFVPRLMLPLSLSYDHRVIDGASAARFMVHLTTVISDLRRVLL